LGRKNWFNLVAFVGKNFFVKSGQDAIQLFLQQNGKNCFVKWLPMELKKLTTLAL
jgi:hypothetical protein